METTVCPFFCVEMESKAGEQSLSEKSQLGHQLGALPIDALSRGDWKFIYFIQRFLIGYFLSKWKERSGSLHRAKNFNWFLFTNQWGEPFIDSLSGGSKINLFSPTVLISYFYFSVLQVLFQKNKNFVWRRHGLWQINKWIWLWFGSQIF